MFSRLDWGFNTRYFPVSSFLKNSEDGTCSGEQEELLLNSPEWVMDPLLDSWMMGLPSYQLTACLQVTVGDLILVLHCLLSSHCFRFIFLFCFVLTSDIFSASISKCFVDVCRAKFSVTLQQRKRTRLSFLQAPFQNLSILQLRMFTTLYLSVQNGGVVCAQTSCPSTACRDPVLPPGECCPVCTGRCFHQGAEYESGSAFTSPSDPCLTCTCLVSLTFLA